MEPVLSLPLALANGLQTKTYMALAKNSPLLVCFALVGIVTNKPPTLRPCDVLVLNVVGDNTNNGRMR